MERFYHPYIDHLNSFKLVDSLLHKQSLEHLPRLKILIIVFSPHYRYFFILGLFKFIIIIEMNNNMFYLSRYNKGPYRYYVIIVNTLCLQRVLQCTWDHLTYERLCVSSISGCWLCVAMRCREHLCWPTVCINRTALAPAAHMTSTTGSRYLWLKPTKRNIENTEEFSIICITLTS